MEKTKTELQDDDETLSLSDLPLFHNCSRKEKQESEICKFENQEEFDFCTLPKEAEMCAADEVFFQGQIMPLQRHSLSSEKGLYPHPPHAPRPESLDRYNSGRFSSSRSSSTGSRHSSSSGCSAFTIRPKHTHKFSPHSQLSPTIPLRGISPGTASHRSIAKKPSVWSILKLGLITKPPETPDFKTRCTLNTKANGGSKSYEKKKPRNIVLSGCNCSSAVAVDEVIVGRSQVAHENGADARRQLSHGRTFEWLNELSIEDPPSGL